MHPRDHGSRLALDLCLLFVRIIILVILAFIPWGLSQKIPRTSELPKGILEMIAAAGFCGQEQVNGMPILGFERTISNGMHMLGML